MSRYVYALGVLFSQTGSDVGTRVVYKPGRHGADSVTVSVIVRDRTVHSFVVVLFTGKQSSDNSDPGIWTRIKIGCLSPKVWPQWCISAGPLIFAYGHLCITEVGLYVPYLSLTLCNLIRNGQKYLKPSALIFDSIGLSDNLSKGKFVHLQ